MGVDERHRYTLLGPVSALGHDGSTVTGAPKFLGVLALLLLHSNQAVPEERFVDLVWGGQPPRSVRTRLQVHMSQLRAALGPDVIVRAGGGYKIVVAEGELDLSTFMDAVNTAREELQGGAAESAARRLRGALSLWTGPALGGVSQWLVERERAGLEEHRMGALEDLFEAELAAGNPLNILGELRRACTEQPFRERFTAQLMLALHRAGQTPEALKVYRDVHHRLVDELGVEPGDTLREVHQRVLNNDLVPDAGRKIAPARRVPAELPRAVDDFVGRGEELAALDQHLRGSGGGCYVISGPAGVGKTALAVRWAHSVRRQFPDGQCYLDLRGFDPEHQPVTKQAAIAQILRSLGVNPKEMPHTFDEQIALYRSLVADLRILILLDNARDIAQVEPLVPPSGSVLVVSRHRLSELVVRAGARWVPLTTLSELEAHRLLRIMVGADRVNGEADAADRLVELCAGLPLALRIAAASIAADPGASIAALVHDLTARDRLGSLVLDGAAESPVSAAFSTSYRALAPPNQAIFRLLGLVPGPDITLAAASALTGWSMRETARRLDALTAANMLEHYSPERYRLHDLLREYAASVGRRDSTRNGAWERLVTFYLHQAVAATPVRKESFVELPRPLPAPEPAEWVAVLQETKSLTEADIDNLVAATVQAVVDGPYPEAWLLADRLKTLFLSHARRAEWLEIAPRLLDAAAAHAELDVQAMLHKSIGNSQFRAGVRDSAEKHLSEAVRLSAECGWREGEATALADLGMLFMWVGSAREAAHYTQRASELFSLLGAPSGANRALSNLGMQVFILGEFEVAESCFVKALSISVEHNLRFAEANNLVSLGSLKTLAGEFREARARLIAGEKIFEELGSVYGRAWSRVEFGRLGLATKDYPAACSDLRRALVLLDETDAAAVRAAAHTMLAAGETELGEYASASGNLDRSLAISRDGDLYWHQAEAERGSARLAMCRDDHEVATSRALRSLEIARRHEFRVSELDGLVLLLELHQRSGKIEDPEAVLADALALARKMGLAHRERDIVTRFSSGR